MPRKVSGSLTLLQLRAIRTRLRNHFGLPRKDALVPIPAALALQVKRALGRDPPGVNIPDAYSLNAVGWTDQRARIVRIISRSELRLELDDGIVALVGQMVDGATLNLGAVTTLETLLGKTAPEDIEADLQETS